MPTRRYDRPEPFDRWLARISSPWADPRRRLARPDRPHDGLRACRRDKRQIPLPFPESRRRTC